MHDFVRIGIRAKHTISLMKIPAIPKPRHEVTHCPARHKARALRENLLHLYDW